MGNHYLPRYYLDGFTSPDTNRLWVYVKGEGRKFQSQPKSVANETDFYSPEIESALANEIEAPANAVLKKIRERVEISPDEKRSLAVYIMTLWKRVPRGLERFNEMAPQIAENRLSRFNDEIAESIHLNPNREDLLRDWQRRGEATLKDIRESPPKDIWEQTLDPRKTPRSIDVLSKMAWQFLVHDKKPVFLTCDNPVFFFSEMGIGNPKSELTFPIGSNLILHANWEPVPRAQFRLASDTEIKQINRRTASNAQNFVFYASDEAWVIRLIGKRQHDLRNL